LLSELEACTAELAHVRESLSAARQEVDELRGKWHEAREKLTALERDQRALEVELPTLVAERDAVKVTQAGQLAEVRQRLAAASTERDQLRRERSIGERALAQSRQALSQAEAQLRSLRATVQAADRKVAALSHHNSRLQTAQTRQRALALGSLGGGVLLLLLLAGQHVGMEGIPFIDKTLPSTELLALGARPSAEIERGEIEHVGDGHRDSVAQQPVAAAGEAADTPTIDLAALEVEPDPTPFWLVALDESESDATSGPVRAAAQGMPGPTDETEQRAGRNAEPQGSVSMQASGAPDAAEQVSNVPHPASETPQGKAAVPRYRIQIGAYREQENVEWALREAQKLGIEPVASMPTGRAASHLTAVAVGAFGTVCEACRAQCRLEELGWEGYLRRY
jgi:hypothetical protein